MQQRVKTKSQKVLGASSYAPEQGLNNVNSKSKTGIETFSLRTSLRKRKWCLNCPYKPTKNLNSNYLECLDQIIRSAKFITKSH